MSWRDRDYYRDDQRCDQPGVLNFALPKLTPVVKYFLIANVAVFILTAILGPRRVFTPFALRCVGTRTLLELWRLITYQFLHDGPWHLLVNMLGLYFFAPHLERLWGSKRFVLFYLGCGIVGGVGFLILGHLTGAIKPLVGASGAILGVLAACAVLFPQMMVLFFFFFLPIRVLALLGVAYYALNILWSRDLADACHLGGMAAGALYVSLGPAWRQFTITRRRGQWEQQLKEEQADQQAVDHILQKVHREGIQSLSWRERRSLRQATERQRQRDRMREQRLKR